MKELDLKEQFPIYLQILIQRLMDNFPGFMT